MRGNEDEPLSAAEQFEELFSKVDPRELATFLDQFGMMLACGLQPGVALDALGDNQPNAKLKSVIEDVNLRIHKGHTLTSALSRHGDVFPSTVLMLIRVGEQGGDLAAQLRRAGEMLERNNNFMAKIKSAVTGPIITALFCGLILFAIVKMVFPKFLAMYESMDIEFPAISKFVFTIVNAVNHPVTLGLVVAFALYAIIYRESLYQKIFDLLLLFPPTQSIVGKVLCATTCETLATLHRDGVPLHRIVTLISQSVTIQTHRSRLQDCRKILISTGSLHESLASIEYFPGFFHSMVAIGEETGALDELLASCQSLLEQEIEVLVERVANALEPLVTCMMGVSMAILFIGMFLPIYGILNNLGGL